MAKNKKPQNQNKSNEQPKEEQATEEVKSAVDVIGLVDKAIEDRLQGLGDLVARLVGESINYDEITTSALQHIEAKKPEGGEAPKWHRLDPEKCYQQCLDRALHIVTNGQTQVYMGQPKNCKMIMEQVVRLANSMFEALAEEFQIAS